VSTFISDIRYSCRSLLKSPGLTLAAIHLVGIEITGVSVNPARSVTRTTRNRAVATTA